MWDGMRLVRIILALRGMCPPVNDRRLTRGLRDAIGTAEIYLSAASVWEIGIKRALGKLDVPDDVFEVAADAGCRSLPITWTHAEAAVALPSHHSDPFDRMLIAQVGCEGLTLASTDSAFRAYDVDLLS